MPPEQISRFIIGFSWLYHGIFPKLLHIAPLEKTMTASFGYPEEITYLITKSAGVGELIFGLIFIAFYKNRHIILLNILGLMGLLFFVAILQPQLLIEAFNPITTNIPLISLSFILLKSTQNQQQLIYKKSTINKNIRHTIKTVNREKYERFMQLWRCEF